VEAALSQASPKEMGSLAAEWLALLECARPHPNARRLGELLRSPLDWSTLMMLLEDHGLLGLAAARLSDCGEDAVPSEIHRKLRDWQRAQVIFTLSLSAELFRLTEHFAACGIGILVTKGPALSMRCYGDPGMRQYSDLDLIVRDGDIQPSTKAMMTLGYEPKVPLTAIQAGKTPGEYVFTRPGTHLLVEFHTERTFRYLPRALQLGKLFDRQIRVRIDTREVPALSTEDELILICVHGAKHFWERLMWIADVAALVSRQDVDWGRATSVAREVGAERMLRVGLRLAADVLHFRIPTQVVAEVDPDAVAAGLAAQIAGRLSLPDSAPHGLFERAAFRMRMRGSFLGGAIYLLRLSFSPTEEDWLPGAEEQRSWLADAIGRPFRLARKYGRGGKSSSGEIDSR
jgi:hypothetical protein